MGVRDTPRYNKGVCCDPVPFPDPPPALREALGAAAERIEAHRARALAADPGVTLMKLYDVVEALRAGRALTAAQQAVHVVAACGVLRDLHDALDARVAEAYGWAWPEAPGVVLERLVQLHDARSEEERRGTVRWLRPAYQAPRAGAAASAAADELGLTPAFAASAVRVPWPATVLDQIAALKAIADAGLVSVEDAAARFTGARRDLVARHLETLAIMGEVQQLADGRYGSFTAAA
jgi:hypothetical protein